MPEVTILIPAAGASSRMRGRDKLLEPVDGTPLLALVVARAMKVSDKVLVTLPPDDTARREAIAGSGAMTVTVSDPSEGMAASIRAGLAALPETSAAVMILPADMPEISDDDLSIIFNAMRDDAKAMLYRGTAADGTPGHPVVFPRDCFDDLSNIKGDTGPRDVLAANRHRLRLIPLPGNHALTDLDTPEAWAAWRAGC